MAKPTRRQLAAVILSLSETIPEQKLATAIATYLVQERRTGELEPLMRDVMKQRAAKHGVLEATVTSAFPLETNIKQHITELLSSKKVIINEIIKPDVLGGVRVETNDVQLDLTVRNRLNRLKTVTMKA